MGWPPSTTNGVSTTPAPTPAPYLSNPCLHAPYSSLPWCDATLSTAQRVADMISRMNLTEKIGSLDTKATTPIDSLGLPPYDWWSEATHGISRVRNDASTPWQTNFAFPITTAQSFNRTVWRKTGNAIGREARAFSNAGNAYSTYWAPVVNLAREPRWGRNIETPGEDPMLTSEYAVQYIEGLQGRGGPDDDDFDDDDYLLASACCKHFAANSMELSTVAGVTYSRHDFDAVVDSRDLADSYLVPFKACVERAKVSGLMCAYNSLNGIPACANDALLGLARERWGFDGYVTSDCDAVEDVYDQHEYEPTPEAVVRDVLRAGTDVDCESFVGEHAASALEQGFITEDDLDAALTRLLTVRARLGHFDDLSSHPYSQLSFETDVCTSDSLARDAVAQSVVLLANPSNQLPILTTEDKTVAIIGPLSNVSQKTATYYGQSPCFDDFGLLPDVAAEFFNDVKYEPGLPNATFFDENLVKDAANVASEADLVLLALGTDLSMAAEGKDAVNITLPDAQIELLDAVLLNSTSTVVILLFTATPLDVRPILEDRPGVPILHVGQPATQTRGIFDVLVGTTSPAGRLVQTWYPRQYADQISIFDFNMRPGSSVWPRPDCAKPYDDCVNGTNPGRTHRFYTGEPVFEFGFGNSYTTFQYKPVSPRRVEVRLNNDDDHGTSSVALTVAVDVTNTGDVTADDVVLAFLVPPDAGQNGVPLQSLVAFERVSQLSPNETTTVHLSAALDHFLEAVPLVEDDTVFAGVTEGRVLEGREGRVIESLVQSPRPRRGEYSITLGVRGTTSGFVEDAFTIHAF